ncbi:hydroxymethylglutaryl-CoA synthase [Gordonia sp. TBRC 11910]|uniref:Hydroxymethylglutaryl-CoA synthase n=1 Tax=Gordonia asplenii TaxID=2725283 RepID=A0A848KSN7_9ACTN|nr:hydroxymethylglutaryl-CoA synthase [Gordonia asplenii]NMO01450.1 hydroxymethylglutaryl-CoA synthase [Gordonia asplenii]
MTVAVLGYGTYFPSWRMAPRDAGHANRIVASFDEDAVTMAVAAARSVIDGLSTAALAQVVLATSSPPYLDKTNATIVHAALGLDRTIAAHDRIGTARSTMSAISADAGPTLLVAADIRTGRPGSADERGGADTAAALYLGSPTTDSPSLADVLVSESRTEEFLDRWREPTELSASSWEERFGYERYAPLITEVADAALDAAGLDQADHVIVTSANSAVAKRATTLVKGQLSTTGSAAGFSGAADPIVALASVLDVAGADETVLLVSAADGVDAVLLRTTGALPAHRQPTSVATQIVGGQAITYPTYLSWRGLLDFEPPRRPEPERPAGPPAGRGSGWKFALQGSRCTVCGFTHLPPMRICRGCGAVDEMTPESVAGRSGRVATFTIDRLAYSPSPPVVDVVVDFDGDGGERGTAAGRSAFEVADARPDELEVGSAVTMTFRRLFTAGGVHNYFWKARQLPSTAESSEA